MAYVKIIKFGTKINLFTTSYLSFLHKAQFFLNENCVRHMKCGDIHRNILFLFFGILKYIFQVKKAYEPSIKSAFALIKFLP
jgi:hypothetical protein